jgi:hypothetical protein
MYYLRVCLDAHIQHSLPGVKVRAYFIYLSKIHLRNNTKGIYFSVSIEVILIP